MISLPYEDPEWIGLWETKAGKYFSLFFLWEKEGVCLDNLGKAKITNWKREQNSLLFKKTYEPHTPDAPIAPIEYSGESQGREVYSGIWKANEEGPFLLTRPNLAKDVFSKRLLELEVNALSISRRD